MNLFTLYVIIHEQRLEMKNQFIQIQTSTKENHFILIL